MQWKSQCLHTGDRRTRTKFAWLPVQCNGDVTAWLERYTVVEEYVRCYYVDDYWVVVDRIVRSSRKRQGDSET